MENKDYKCAIADVITLYGQFLLKSEAGEDHFDELFNGLTTITAALLNDRKKALTVE